MCPQLTAKRCNTFLSQVRARARTMRTHRAGRWSHGAPRATHRLAPSENREIRFDSSGAVSGAGPYLVFSAPAWQCGASRSREERQRKRLAGHLSGHARRGDPAGEHSHATRLRACQPAPTTGAHWHCSDADSRSGYDVGDSRGPDMADRPTPLAARDAGTCDHDVGPCDRPGAARTRLASLPELLRSCDLLLRRHCSGLTNILQTGTFSPQMRIKRRHHLQGFFAGSGIEIAANPRAASGEARAHARRGGRRSDSRDRPRRSQPARSAVSGAMGAPVTREILLRGLRGRVQRFGHRRRVGERVPAVGVAARPVEPFHRRGAVAVPGLCGIAVAPHAFRFVPGIRLSAGCAARCVSINRSLAPAMRRCQLRSRSSASRRARSAACSAAMRRSMASCAAMRLRPRSRKRGGGGAVRASTTRRSAQRDRRPA